jgi:hypothetical protein
VKTVAQPWAARNRQAARCLTTLALGCCGWLSCRVQAQPPPAQELEPATGLLEVFRFGRWEAVRSQDAMHLFFTGGFSYQHAGVVIRGRQAVAVVDEDTVDALHGRRS